METVVWTRWVLRDFTLQPFLHLVAVAAAADACPPCPDISSPSSGNPPTSGLHPTRSTKARTQLLRDVPHDRMIFRRKGISQACRRQRACSIAVADLKSPHLHPLNSPTISNMTVPVTATLMGMSMGTSIMLTLVLGKHRATPMTTAYKAPDAPARLG